MTNKPPGSRAQRVSVNLKVNLKLQNRQQFEERFAQNISRSGIFIRAKEPVPVGSRVKFEYRLADKTRIMRGVGLVRWARTKEDAREPQEPPGMGIEFVDIDADTDELITHMVAKYGEGERAPRKERKERKERKPAASPAAAPAPMAAAIDESKLDSEEADALDALMDDWGDAGGAATPTPPSETPASAGEPANAPAAELGSKSASPSGSVGKPASDRDPLLDSIDALLGETADVTSGAAPAAGPTPGEAEAPADDAEIPFAGDEVEIPLVANESEAEDDPLAEIAGEAEAQLEHLGEIPLEREEVAAAAAAVGSAADALPDAFGDDEVADAVATVGSAAGALPDAPGDEGAEDLEELDLDVGAGEEASSEPLAIDVCGAEIVASRGNDPETTQSELIVPRLAITGGSLHVDDAGFLFPHITSWLPERWPNPAAVAAGRHLGINLATSADGEPAIEAGGELIPIALAIQATMAAVIRPFRGEAAPSQARVIVPSGAGEKSRTAVRDALMELGVGSVELTEDVAALIAAAAVSAGPGQSILTVQVGMHETRVALAEGPQAVLATATFTDACTAKADQLLFVLASIAFLRSHGIDAEADPTQHDDLAQQTHEGAETFGDDPWQLRLGEASVVLTPEAVVQATASLSERVALACDALMGEQMISGDDLHATLFVSDSNPWPGLLPTLSEMLGVTPRVMEEGGWTRIDGLKPD